MLWIETLGFTHRPLSSSFWGLAYRILNINHKKELLRGLWVGLSCRSCRGFQHEGIGPDRREFATAGNTGVAVVIAVRFRV